MVHEIPATLIGVCGRHRYFPVVTLVGANNFLFTLAHDPSDEHSNYQETLRLRLQYECVGHAITFTRAPHTPSEKKNRLSEV